MVDTGATTTYTQNGLGRNQYQQVGNDAVGNDNEHAMKSYQTNSYTYVNDERLSSIVNGSNSYSLVYDALGRCVKRTLNGTTTYYIYDGEKPIVEYNSAGSVVGRNLYGKAIDEILMRIDGTYGTYYYADDHEGSVTHLLSSAGAILEHYRYDVFGAPSIEDANGSSLTASAYNNRFMFTGREYKSQFGIYEYRARAYHPGLGRFTGEDPKGFEAKDYNLFRYVGNDPLDKTDPMGLVGPGSNSPNDQPMTDSQELARLRAQLNARLWSYGATALAPLYHQMTQLQQSMQGNQGLTIGQMTQGPQQAQHAPKLDPTLLREMKTGTDTSTQAASHDNVPYMVASYDKDGKQAFTKPAPGRDLGLGRYEERSEPLPQGAHLRDIGHYHPPGKASFSEKDMKWGVPIMKNLDKHSGEYDVYSRGWRYYFDSNLKPVGNPYEYP